MTHTFEIEFIPKRCWKCGSYWAIEKSRDSDAHCCPRCDYQAKRELLQTISTMERSINALRGAFNRKKK